MELTLTYRILIKLAKLGIAVACIFGLVKIVLAVKNVVLLGPLALLEAVPGVLIIIAAVVVYAVLECLLKMIKTHVELRDALEDLLKKRH